MEKTLENCGQPGNFKPAAVIIFIMIICVMGLVAGISYANSDTRIVLLSNTIKENINESEPAEQQSLDNWHTVKMRVTAYCSCPKCCGSYSDGITASGHKIFENDRFVASDRKYSFGTQMIIPGYNNSQTVEVLDRGGAIRGDRLDVYFDTHEQALQWGVRYLDVKILVQ
ncbi:MAG: 3D domain-containing protein [Phycisphaerae bacterium]